MLRYAVIALSLLLLPMVRASADECGHSATAIEQRKGEHISAPFSFEFISFIEQTQLNGLYRAERCVKNVADQMLWFDWKKVELSTALAKDNLAAKGFDTFEQDISTGPVDFWWGTRPDKITPDTVLLKNEAALVQDGKVWLAQASNAISFADAFQSSESFSAYISPLQKENPQYILRTSAASIVMLPRDEKVWTTFRANGCCVEDDEFYSVGLRIDQYYEPSGTDGFSVTMVAGIYVHERDRELFQKNEGSISISLEGSDPAILKVIERSEFTTETGHVENELLFKASYFTNYPAKPRMLPMKVKFGEYAHVDLPIIFVNGG